MKILSKEMLSTEQVEEEGDSVFNYYPTYKCWTNKNGAFYRVDGPCYESETGYKEYRQDKSGKTHLHREDGPALEFASGRKEYYLNGINIDPKDFKLRIENGVSGEMWINALGVYHNPDGAALIKKDGTKLYLIYGQRHREDGPAIIRTDGTKEYWIRDRQVKEEDLSFTLPNIAGFRNIKGELHRLAGPAYIGIGSRCEYYYHHGKLHREDGPAIIYPDGSGLYYLNGNKIEEEKFKSLQKSKQKEQYGYWSKVL